MGKLVYEQETFKIIGAAMAVHTGLGAGFLESVYHEALEVEFKNQLIPFETKKKLMVYYLGKPLKKYFVADFICYENIVIEIKSASFLHKIAEAQTINYLKSINAPVGLLLNFGQTSLTWKRFVNTNKKFK
ncbi:GxxExxY protein [Aequorivita sp. SDUM287046]|uniref:GxxExxY protein n=1 Tax=Aequorivita aurantiaca TaxID=3053356 RepID=A0ABT8DF60_9FLAO|nr:GxxExxY protein [Aequorivita aurantiaca]MDN3723971.1 GxxExxY protein [Aequorivita aurantiaca]